jgi:Uma2 family endonuclease
MSQPLAGPPFDLDEIVENIVTEDDEPVDNLFSAKQQRLLTRTLYSSWTPPPSEDQPNKPRKFLADSNVGIFFAVHQPPLVPDVFLSLDVAPHKDWYDKAHRAYFVWEFGKVPELVIEIVSNRKGGELTSKLKNHARMGVNYYVVYDPEKHLSKEVLRVYELSFGKRYRLRENNRLPDLGLSLTLWKGTFEGIEDTWLRWRDSAGLLIPTGEERAAKAEAELKKLRAELARRTHKPARKRAQ